MRPRASGVNSSRCSAGVNEPSQTPWRSTSAIVHALEEALELEVEAQVAERDREAVDGGLNEPAPEPARDQLDHAGEAMRLVRRVTGEQLVAAVARERDRHRAAGEAREQERRDQRRVAERLVEEVGQPLDEVEGAIGLQDLLVVVGAECLRHAARVGGFVERRILEADREGLEAPPAWRAARAATALESIPPERNTPSGTSLTRCWRTGGRGRRGASRPPPRRRSAVGAERELQYGSTLTRPSVYVSQWPAGSLRIERKIDARRRDVLVGEVARERREVERAIDRRVLDEGLELGGEDDLVAAAPRSRAA